MRNFTRTILAGAAATACVLGFSSPANAAIEVCFMGGNTVPQCASTDVNVLVNQQTAGTVTASDNDTGTNVTYSFTSTTDPTLVQVASGQADVTSTDGVLNQITFNILGGTASLVTFNLVPLGPQSPGLDATSVFVVNFLGGSTTISGLAGNGQNFFGIRATAGEQITSLAFGPFSPLGANTGIQALNQVRLDLNGTTAIPAVPEPGTWAMMLLGFGAVGFSLRRSRRATLLQAA